MSKVGASLGGHAGQDGLGAVIPAGQRVSCASSRSPSCAVVACDVPRGIPRFAWFSARIADQARVARVFADCLRALDAG